MRSHAAHLDSMFICGMCTITICTVCVLGTCRMPITHGVHQVALYVCWPQVSYPAVGITQELKTGAWQTSFSLGIGGPPIARYIPIGEPVATREQLSDMLKPGGIACTWSEPR